MYIYTYSNLHYYFSFFYFSFSFIFLLQIITALHFNTRVLSFYFIFSPQKRLVSGEFHLFYYFSNFYFHIYALVHSNRQHLLNNFSYLFFGSKTFIQSIKLIQIDMLMIIGDLQFSTLDSVLLPYRNYVATAQYCFRTVRWN